MDLSIASANKILQADGCRSPKSGPFAKLELSSPENEQATPLHRDTFISSIKVEVSDAEEGSEGVCARPDYGMAVWIPVIKQEFPISFQKVPTPNDCSDQACDHGLLRKDCIICLFSKNAMNQQTDDHKQGLHTPTYDIPIDNLDSLNFRKTFKITNTSNKGSTPKRKQSRRVYPCKDCVVVFHKKGDLSKHRETHKDGKPFSCKKCLQTFVRRHHLAYHMRSHIAVKPHPCSQCSKRFHRKWDLVRHLISHTGEKFFSCEVCEKRFSHKSVLVVHIRTHTGERPYSCEECCKKFYKNSDLVRHRITHTNAKPFICTHCKRGFNNRSNLLTHMITHREVRPYDCEECGRQFGKKGDLAQHLKSHDGQKKYVCEVCKKSFGLKRNLLRHEGSH